MAINHEEADTMIAGALEALVVSDDANVFVLLCQFVYSADIFGRVWMVFPFRSRSVIDIKEITDRNKHIMPSLLATHGLIVIQFLLNMELAKLVLCMF